MTTEMRMRGFYLDKDNENKLDAHATRYKMSKSKIVRQALTVYLDLHQDYPGTIEAARQLSTKKQVSLGYVISQALYKAIPEKYFRVHGLALLNRHKEEGDNK